MVMKRNRIYICVLSVMFMWLFIWCPVMYALDKTNLVSFEDLRNYKDPDKVYEDDELLADFLNSIEQGKADLTNIYTNYLPLYSQIITYMQNLDRNAQSDFMELLERDNAQQVNNLNNLNNVDDLNDLDNSGNSDNSENLENSDTSDLSDDLGNTNNSDDNTAETQPPEDIPVKIESKLLLDDNFHRYYKVEPYKFLDRWILSSGDKLRKSFDRQVLNINKIIASDTNVNFYVYICTRMQDTEYSKEIVPNEFSTLDFFNEFIDSIKGAKDIGWFDIDTVEKRVEKVFRTDHHWSARGAYSGYVDVINMMKKNTPEIGEPLPLNGETGLITFEDVEMRGSFAAIMRYDEYYEEFSVLDITLPKFTKADVHIDAYERYKAGKFDKGTFADHYVAYYNSSGQRKYTVKGNNTGRNILIIGDSYTWWFSWMVAANFDNVYIYLPPWDKKNFQYNQFIADNGITDVLLIQFSDRLFFNYYSDSNFSSIRTS